MRRIKNILFYSVLLIPPVLMLLSLALAPVTPYYDYWHHFFIPFFNMDSPESYIRVLLTKSNEHFIVIPNLFYTINIFLFKGNNRGLYLIAWLLTMGEVLILAKTIYIMKSVSTLTKKVLLLSVVMFLFAPVAAHNWIFSMSGIAWFSANFLLVLALYLYYRLVNMNSKYGYMFVLLFVVSLLGAFAYSTGIFIYFIISLLLLYSLRLITEKRYRLLTYMYLLSAGSFYFIYFKILYSRPAYHPHLTINIRDTVKFILLYFGRPFSQHTICAQYIGLIGLIIAGVLVISGLLHLYRKPKDVFITLPMSLIGYSVINAFATEVTRGGFGVNMAMASRYINISLIFWLGVLSLTILLFNFKTSDLKKLPLELRFLFISASVLVVIALSYTLYYKGYNEFSELSKQYIAKENMIILSFDLGSSDTSLNQRFLGVSDISVITSLPGINDYVPFNKRLIPNNLLTYDENTDISDSTIQLEYQTIRSYGDIGGPDFVQFYPITGHTYDINSGVIYTKDGKRVGVLLHYKKIYSNGGYQDGAPYLGYLYTDEIQSDKKYVLDYMTGQNTQRIEYVTIQPPE